MTVEARHTFTRDELRELGERLARRAQSVYDLREQLAEHGAAIKAQIKSAEGDVALLARKINEGYELRPTECEIVYNLPKRGVKTLIRLDNGEAAGEMAMTPEEQQQQLPFDGKKQ